MCESLSQLFLQVLTRRDGNSCYMCFGVEWMELLVDEPAGQTQQVGHRWSISTGRAFRVKFHALFAAAAVAGGINQRVVTLGVRSSQSVAGHWTARNSDQTLKHFRLCSQVSATQSHRWPWRWRWFWTRKSHEVPGELHGDFTGFAESVLDADVHLAEHTLLAVRVLRLVAQHVTKGQRSHHRTGLVDDAGNRLDGLPHAPAPLAVAAVVVAIAGCLLGQVFLWERSVDSFQFNSIGNSRFNCFNEKWRSRCTSKWKSSV